MVSASVRIRVGLGCMPIQGMSIVLILEYGLEQPYSQLLSKY